MRLSAIKLSAEVSATLCSEYTKYCPMLNVWDLLVFFIDAEYMYFGLNICLKLAKKQCILSMKGGKKLNCTAMFQYTTYDMYFGIVVFN